MNLLIPPQPTADNDPSSVAWSDWYTKVRYAMNSSGLDWTAITSIPAALTGFAATVFAANKGIYATGTATFGTFDFPSFARGAMNATTSTEFRTNIEAGEDITAINTQNNTYTTVASDMGKTIAHTSASAHTWTIAAEASVNYDIGTVISFMNDTGGGSVTIAIGGSDVMVMTGSGATGNRTLAANGRASALKIAAGRWQISGANLT